MTGFEKIIASAVILLWPLIPVFWLPMRIWPGLKKRLGPFYFLAAGILWLPLALLLWSSMKFVLSFRLPIPSFISLTGLIFFSLGLALQLFMAIRLGNTIVGLHELTGQKGRLETSFPYTLCRHPTYLSHFMMFFGAAFATGFIAVFIVALLDLFITVFLMIPREERDLIELYGKAYEDYRRGTNCLLPDMKRFLSVLFRNRQEP